MKIVLGGQNDEAVINGIYNILENSKKLDIAVSYVQLGGWKIIQNGIQKFGIENVRLLCTSQLGITDPLAIRHAIESGISVKNYSVNSKTFHPKVFLSYSDKKPTRYFLGSSNISVAALTKSVEANITGDDDGSLAEWFDNIFENEAEEFDDEMLSIMEENYKNRRKLKLRSARTLKRKPANKSIASEEINIVEDLFDAIDDEVGMLNFDHGGNTIRNIQRAKTVINDKSEWPGKNIGELRRLGLVEDDKITSVGNKFHTSRDLHLASKHWIKWLLTTSDNELSEINPHGRLLRAKKAHTGFAALRNEVKKYFIINSTNPSKDILPYLQTIELVSNLENSASKLNLREVKMLGDILQQYKDENSASNEFIKEYLNNRGRRGWKFNDREMLTSASIDILKSNE